MSESYQYVAALTVATKRGDAIGNQPFVADKLTLDVLDAVRHLYQHLLKRNGIEIEANNVVILNIVKLDEVAPVEQVIEPDLIRPAALGDSVVEGRPLKAGSGQACMTYERFRELWRRFVPSGSELSTAKLDHRPLAEALIAASNGDFSRFEAIDKRLTTLGKHFET